MPVSIVLGILILPVALLAEDLTTLNGKTYTNISDIKAYPDQVVFTWNSERTPVAITNLSAEVCAKYGVNYPSAKSGVPASSRANLTDSILAQYNDSDLKVEKTVTQLFTNESAVYRFVSRHDCSLQMESHQFRLLAYSSACDSSGNQLSKSQLDGTFGFRYDEVSVALQIFDKFLEWTGVAETNHVEPFTKYLKGLPDASTDGSPFRGFAFQWLKDSSNTNGWAILVGYFPAADTNWMSCGGAVQKVDVYAFRDLLKSIPGLKDELAQKIKNKEAQKDLFK